MRRASTFCESMKTIYRTTPLAQHPLLNLRTLPTLDATLMQLVMQLLGLSLAVLASVAQPDHEPCLRSSCSTGASLFGMAYTIVDPSSVAAAPGPHPAASPFDKRVSEALGISAFEVYQVELPPEAETVRHDHPDDGVEDLYLTGESLI